MIKNILKYLLSIISKLEYNARHKPLINKKTHRGIVCDFTTNGSIIDLDNNCQGFLSDQDMDKVGAGNVIKIGTELSFNIHNYDKNRQQLIVTLNKEYHPLGNKPLHN